MKNNKYISFLWKTADEGLRIKLDFDNKVQLFYKQDERAIATLACNINQLDELIEILHDVRMAMVHDYALPAPPVNDALAEASAEETAEQVIDEIVSSFEGQIVDEEEERKKKLHPLVGRFVDLKEVPNVEPVYTPVAGFPSFREKPDYKHASEALSATTEEEANVRMEVRGRDKWLYVRSDDTLYALSVFNKPEGTPMQMHNGMIAVWNGKTQEPDCLPEFQ